jgi:hypothetical protein
MGGESEQLLVVLRDEQLRGVVVHDRVDLLGLW